MPVTTSTRKPRWSYVTLPLDAITDVDPLVHENNTIRIFPRIAETGTAADVLAMPSTRGASR